jgi:hypothetical protein
MSTTLKLFCQSFFNLTSLVDSEPSLNSSDKTATQQFFSSVTHQSKLPYELPHLNARIFFLFLGIFI